MGSNGDQPIQHNSLAANSDLSRTVTISTSLETGVAYAIIDSNNQIQESNDNDNIGGGFSWQVPPLPANLVISVDNVSASTATGGSNEIVIINFMIKILI